MRSSWLLLAATEARAIAGVVSLPPTSLLRPLGRVRLQRTRFQQGYDQRTRLLVAQQGYDPQGYDQQGGYDQQQQDYAQQQGTAQQGYAQPGGAQALPAGWAAGVDEASGATYYYHAQTGESTLTLPGEFTLTLTLSPTLAGESQWVPPPATQAPHVLNLLSLPTKPAY